VPTSSTTPSSTSTITSSSTTSTPSSSSQFGGYGAYGSSQADSGSSSSSSSFSAQTSQITNPQISHELSDHDLDELAAKELQTAMAAIENLIHQLESKPRKTINKPPNAEITFDDVSDAILDATQAIALAANVLLKSSAVAQRERMEHHLSTSEGGKYHSDAVWAQGLISASHFVVAAVQNLVVTADAVIKGKEKHEKLVAAAATVTASTAQLVAAHRAKGDANKKSSADLEAAASGITKATARLVQAAQMASQPIEVEAGFTTNPQFTLTELNKKKLETKARVLELEKEAERARKALEDLNKQEYSHTGSST